MIPLTLRLLLLRINWRILLLLRVSLLGIALLRIRPLGIRLSILLLRILGRILRLNGPIHRLHP